MVDVYKIGVSIGMTNNVSSVLRIIQRDLFGLKNTVDLTQGSFNRLKFAALGAAGAFAGLGLLDVFKGLADAGGAVVNQQAKMLQIGISQRDVANETAVAYQNIAIAGSTVAGNLAGALKLRSIFGGSGFQETNMALPGFLQAQFALRGAGINPSQIDDFIKPLDVMGAFKTGNTLDPAKFGPAMQMAVSAVLSSGGLLTGAMFQRAVQLAGPAAAAMGEQKFFQTMLEPLLALGTKAARGLQYGGSTFIGGQTTKATAMRLDRLGLTSARDYTHEGGRWTLDPNKIAGSKLLNKGDIIDWIQSYFLPAAAKADMNPMVAASTLPQTLQALISTVYEIGPQIAKSIMQQQQANQTDPYAAAMTSMSGAESNFSSAFTALWQALGTPALQMAIPWINRFATAIRTFTDWVGTHQTAVSIAERILLGLGAALTVLGTAALTVLGTAAIATAIASMVGTGGTLVLIAGALSGLAIAVNGIPGATMAAEKALQTFVYDLLHPISFIASTAGTPAEHHGYHWQQGLRGGAWVPNAAPSGSGVSGGGIVKSINAVQDEMLAALYAWINAGAPTNAHVTNPADIGTAAAAKVHRDLTAPNSGPSGFNGTASPPGSSASSGHQ